MRLRSVQVLFVGAIFAACAGETAETGADADTEEAPPEMASAADEAAIEGVLEGYVEHYNLHHASMVADMYTEDALTLFADGSFNEGKEAIAAALEAAMAGSPTLGIENADVMVFGDNAVSRGAYSVETMPEGAETISFGGHYIVAFDRTDAGWKLGFVISNFDTDRPEGLPLPLPPEEGGEEMEPLAESPTAEVVASYAEHFNMGHGSVVAELYAEDATAASAGRPLAEGRAAIQAALDERLAEGSPQLSLTEYGMIDLGDGWVLSGGAYELSSEGTVAQTGSYTILCSPRADGSMQIHWAISNASPM